MFRGWICAAGGAWPIALLFAGLLVNAFVIESVSAEYSVLAHHPWRLHGTLILVGAFLSFAVFSVALRLGNLEDAVALGVGTRAARVFQQLMVPGWAAAWFACVMWFAFYCLGLVVGRSHVVELGGASVPTFGVALVWLVMVAPAASMSLPMLARRSVLVVKVSLGAVIGLALSTAKYVPDALDELREGGPAEWVSLEPLLLLWAVPPLLLAEPLVREFRSNRRILVTIMVAGIVLPILITVLAGDFTLAGARALGPRYTRRPSYLAYAFSRPEQLGWAKVLVLSFTLLTASRFAANIFVGSLPGGRSVGRCFGATALLMAMSFGLRAVSWEYSAWQYLAIPFAPLAGVLAGTLAVPSTPDAQPQRLSLLAWVAGCVTTCLPIFTAQYPDPFGIWPVWIVSGWLVSLVGTYLARRRGLRGDRRVQV